MPLVKSVLAKKKTGEIFNDHPAFLIFPYIDFSQKTYNFFVNLVKNFLKTIEIYLKISYNIVQYTQNRVEAPRFFYYFGKG